MSDGNNHKHVLNIYEYKMYIIVRHFPNKLYVNYSMHSYYVKNNIIFKKVMILLVILTMPLIQLLF